VWTASGLPALSVPHYPLVQRGVPGRRRERQQAARTPEASPVAARRNTERGLALLDKLEQRPVRNVGRRHWINRRGNGWGQEVRIQVLARP
jgi:hypothetical protein